MSLSRRGGALGNARFGVSQNPATEPPHAQGVCFCPPSWGQESMSQQSETRRGLEVTGQSGICIWHTFCACCVWMAVSRLL